MHRAIPTLARNVLGIVGRSGSGKTTLLEFLVAQLAQQGLRVNIIKHSHHDLVLEPAHKDSARLRSAGAAEVLVASPYRFAIMHELRGAPEPTLEEQVARLAPADLTLVEGFKSYPVAKLEVFRAALGQLALYREDPFIVAVASDQPVPADLPDGMVWLDLNAPQAVFTWLLEHIK
ncbi:MAG: molybdopterin-guanine dinucleotide biosynthesis protein B [Janthinobacterium sp.]|jgi:molybdopterin-guanine dinucleotide biosynthesis protein B